MEHSIIIVASFIVTIVSTIVTFLWKINDIRVEQGKVDSKQNQDMAVLENKIQNMENKYDGMKSNIEEIKKTIHEMNKDYNISVNELKNLIRDNNTAIDKISLALEHLIRERQELKDLIIKKGLI